MSDEDYENLLRGFCRLAGIGDCTTFLREGRLVFEGRQLALTPVKLEGMTFIDAVVDLERVPESRRIAVYESMLETNMLLGALGGGRFALDPDSGNAVFFERISLEGHATPHGLRDVLLAYISQVQAWTELSGASA